MAAASDKARFFLEQSVPELKEYERKKIFSAAEISSIARQRSDFEHKINARGTAASDFIRYAEFEINVDALKKKRVHRLGIRSTNHSVPRRIFYIFDRSTKKHPADIGLWMQSIEYARRQKAHKKLSQIFTNVLRLHPNRPELWVYAAQFAMEEHGDMTEARSYMQRGLRFCRSKRSMWIQYARLELMYIAKIYTRRQILGINEEKPENVAKSKAADEDELGIAKEALQEFDADTDQQLDEAVLDRLDALPAQSSAIPIAIFDEAMSHFNNDPAFAESFVEMIEDFSHVPAARNVLERILDGLRRQQCAHWIVRACEVQLPLFGIPTSSEAFPSSFRESLKRFKAARAMTPRSGEFDTWARRWLQHILGEEDLDAALQTVVRAVRDSLPET